MKKIELLAPAGSIDSLSAAMDNGADACFMGLKNFNARMRGTNFAYNQLEAAVEQAHLINRKIYITFNTLVTQRELHTAASSLNFLSDINVDGVIVQDLGIAQLIKQKFKRLRYHASTQMAVASSVAVNFLASQGCKRVVLARELTLDEIENITKNCPETEIEVFCHGSLCVAYSGLCMFSSYLGGASANRGQCTQACRRQYNTKKEAGMFFSTRDLQAIDSIPLLAKAGVSSLKIEGRMKNATYVANVVKAYRYVLDNLEDSDRAIAVAKEYLSQDFARSKTSFFMNDRNNTDYLNKDLSGATGLYLGKLTTKNEKLYLETTYELNNGDYVRLQRHDDSYREAVKIKDLEKNELGYLLNFESAIANDLVYLSAVKEEKIPSFLPANLDKYNTKPEPFPLANNRTSFTNKNFKNGNYLLFNKIDDFNYSLLKHTDMLCLELNTNMIKELRSPKKPLPLKKNQIAIYLEPFLAEEKVKSLQANLEELVKLGYQNFIANNVGHIAMLQLLNTNWIAGPWLYVHNNFAIDFYQKAGASMISFGIEASKETVLSLIKNSEASRFLLTMFSRVELFQLRSNLGSIYTFQNFSDKEGENYNIISNKDGSKVYGERAICITHDKKFLEDQGVSHFLYDFRISTNIKEMLLVLEKPSLSNKLGKSGLWNLGFKERPTK